MAMETGLIFHPYMRPERTARQTFEWGVQSAIAADKAGFTSMMISEHASQVWENIPNPELIMSAAALIAKSLAKGKNPTEAEIEAAMADNLCRCGTYQRIVQAVRRASELAQA